MIEETELSYLKDLIRGNSDKFTSETFLNEVHEKASFTATILTQEMIEGKVPMEAILD